MNAIEDGYSEELAEYVASAMEEKGLTTKDLAKELGVVYEHARKLKNGYVQSGPVMKVLSSLLGLNLEELEYMVAKASIERKYPGFLPRVTGVNPELGPIEKLWDRLSEDQKTDLTTMAKTMVRRNKK